MANKEHLAILMEALEKNDIGIWNQWRRDNWGLRVNLSDADLANLNLIDVDLRGTDLRGVNLSNSDLINADFVDSNLSGANLYGVYLRDANLRGANLSRTYLSNANLNDSNLSDANLKQANLTDTDLSRAHLTRANLRGTHLISANLSDTNLGRAELIDADLNRARCNITMFSDVDLSQVKNLDKVKHDGPSTIGIDTLYKSGGNIPEMFLRGCGVPDNLIIYAKSLVDKPIDYYSVFISYSTANEDFAELLYNTLQGAGIRCWYAPEQLLPGQRIDDGIHRGIQYWDKVLFCASKSSLTEKWWVDFEVDKAFKKSRDLQRERGEQVGVLIPLNLDGHMFSEEYKNHPRASQFETTLAADFVGWKNDIDKFNREVKRVIKALQTDGGLEEPPPSKL